VSDVRNLKEAYHWNLTRISEAFGFHRDTVRKRLKEAGVNPESKRGNADLYSLEKVGPALFGTSTSSGVKLEYTPEELWPKDRKEWFQSENERLKFQENIGDLIPVNEHREDLLKTIKATVSFFESLSDKMERRRSFTPDQLEELDLATDEFRTILHNQLLEIKDNA
tara:strand:- start:384 stop:884 length:501 start_codon:yes stop_codon:yes gene_type:complete